MDDTLKLKQMAGLFDVTYDDVALVRTGLSDPGVFGTVPRVRRLFEQRYEIRNMEGLRYDQMDQLARILGTERINFSWIRDAHQRGESTYYGTKGTLLLSASYGA